MTGLSATLGAFLHAVGSGAPSPYRRALVTLSALATTLAALVLMATPALAAGPTEAPVTSAPANVVTATTATFEGVLNPKAAVAATAGYYFAYSPEISCMIPGLTTPLQAEAPVKAENVQAKVTGLQPSREYRFCLVATNAEGETPGNEVALKTSPAPPTIEAESTSPFPPNEGDLHPRAAHEVRLDGVVNANNEPTECHFEYEVEESLLAAPTTALCEPGALVGSFGGQSVGLNVGGLETDKTYYYRIVAKNGAGETKGTEVEPIKHFKTAFEPEVPEKAKATGETATTATLHGVLNPASNHESEPGSYEFVYRQSATECQREVTETVENPFNHQKEEIHKEVNEHATPSTKATGKEKEPVEAEVKELVPGATYTFCLLVRNEAGEEALGAPETFKTPPRAPFVEEAFTTEVSATSATLHATVNPSGLETSYRFEYAPAGGAFAPVPEPTGHGSGTLAAGTTPVSVEVHLREGLEPNTSYEFRLVASHASEAAVTSKAVSFTTQRGGETLVLPDGRQWEEVTPPDKHGALFFGYEFDEYTIQASVAGNAIADEASQPTEPAPPGFVKPVAILSTRGPGGGWSSQVIEPPHAQPTGPPVGGGGSEYRFFSEDLSLAVVQPFGGFTLALSPQGTEQTSYLHSDYLNGNVSEHCASSCFTPLVDAANTRPGAEFGEEQSDGECIGANFQCGPLFVAATPDLSHVLVHSSVQLTTTPFSAADPISGTKEGPFAQGGGMYEWSGGQLQLVSILPDGEAGPAGMAAAPIQGDGSQVGQRHVISSDGSHVLLQQGEGNTASLFLRDTNPLSSGDPNAQTTVAIGTGQYRTASADDAKVFFTHNGELDEYDATSRHTTELTPSVFDVLGASEDGSYVYFTSGAAFTSDAETTVCHETYTGTEAEDCNIYVIHAGGEPTLIGPAGQPKGEARVSPNGRYLAFMSDRNLTNYDTHDAVSGHLDQEVYLYDAVANRLVCASCNPTGAQPTGVLVREALGLRGGRTLTGRWVSATVPPPTRLDAEETLYQSRYLSNQGRVFFNSLDGLVPQDVNGTWDVYQYEPSGITNAEGRQLCTNESSTFSLSSAGCVGLISSGTSPEESAFLDASESGSDVFFLTTSKLVPQDLDTALDAYDAHECSASAPCPPAAAEQPPPCTTEASCKASPSPQPSIYAAPSSATFSGLGNPAAPAPAKVTKKTVKCKKGFVKNKKGKCVKKPKSKKKTKKTNRRAGR